MDLARLAVWVDVSHLTRRADLTPWLESEARRCLVTWILGAWGFSEDADLGVGQWSRQCRFRRSTLTGGPLCEPTLTEVLVVPGKGGPRVWRHLRPSTRRGCLGTQSRVRLVREIEPNLWMTPTGYPQISCVTVSCRTPSIP